MTMATSTMTPPTSRSMDEFDELFLLDVAGVLLELGFFA